MSRRLRPTRFGTCRLATPIGFHISQGYPLIDIAQSFPLVFDRSTDGSPRQVPTMNRKWTSTATLFPETFSIGEVIAYLIWVPLLAMFVAGYLTIKVLANLTTPARS